MSVPGLARGIALLRLFRRDRRMLSPADIASELHLPRSTVHRLLGELMELGLVRRECDGRYVLDSGVLTLGFEYLASNDLVTLSAPLLEGLRDRTNWSTHLAVRQGQRAVYLSRYPARAAVTRNVVVGTSLPAHATVMGRVLLADLEPAELQALYPRGVPAHEGAADDGPPSLAQLQQRIAVDRERGHAAEEGYFESGVVAIAAPVRDMSLKTVAAINAIHVGAAVEDMAAMTSAVVETAEAISRLLGAPGRMPALPRALEGEIA
ncbi:IclR family transcriptional regulator [Sphingobium sp.]|uniref:IclR family transcriptional regulator n=1 Tax=Sphingobium sp. TaxID=1912891 RepID=UPI0035C67BF6